MDSNYEWQQFRANERAQVLRGEAETHRLAKMGGKDRLSITRRVMALVKTFLPVMMRTWRKRFSRTVSAGCEMEERERLVEKGA